MKYKLLLLDIDGTLRPGSCERVPKENAEAVCAVQKAGVKIAIATGRGRIGVGKGLLRSIRPDYWVCAGGAQLVDYKGADLALHRLTTEEMYALVDFFEDYDLPLRFTYHDANYAYLGYEEFARREREKNLALNIVDGEDQDKHLEEMPFGAFGFLSQEMADRFQEKYGYLGLNFLFSYPGSDGCDILRQGVVFSQGQGRASRVRELTFTYFYGRHLLMQNKTTNIRKLTGTAMLGAVAAVLMYMEFPIPIMPSFVKLDVSELPALLAAYAYGPVSGIAVCLIKNLIKLPSTSTAAVGELFNFVMGALFVGVAGFVYKRSKTRRSALIGAGLGALIMAVVSVPYNYFIVYPAYVVLYHLPLEAIIGMYQAINPSVDGLLTCLITFNFPFTLFKGLLDAALCFLIYKPLSGVLHGRK